MNILRQYKCNIMWVKQQYNIPQITVNRWSKQFPNEWFIFVLRTLLLM